MNSNRQITTIQLSQFKSILRRITLTIVFSIFLVLGIITSIVEASFIVEEIGFLSLTPLLICALVLSLISVAVLSYLFFYGEWKIQIIRSETTSPHTLVIPDEVGVNNEVRQIS